MDGIEIITKDDVIEMETDPDPVDKEDAKNQNNGPAPTNTKTNDSPPANHSGGKREADITSPVIDVDGDATTKVCLLSRLCWYLCLNSLFRILIFPPEVSQTTTLPRMKTIGGSPGA